MKKLAFLRAFAASAILLGLSHSANATNLFNWGVESNMTTVGYNVSYFGGSSRDCTVAHSGACSMKLVVQGNDGGNQQMGADLVDWSRYSFNIVGGPALYYRWWMKIMPGFSWGSGTYKTKASRVIGATAGRGYTGYVQKDGFFVSECETVAGVSGGGCLDANGKPNNDYLISVKYDMTPKADGNWHEYIVMVKPNSTSNTSDAQLKVWIDGVSVGQYVNWRLHNVANNKEIDVWGGWMVSPYFQLNGTTSDGGTIYVDDFSTDDAWNSLTSGGGNTILNAPPAAPSGLNAAVK